MANYTFRVLLLISSILFIILASWSLNTYNKLSEVDQAQVEGKCGVKSDSIKNGKNFSLIMLVASIVVLLIVGGELIYKETNLKDRVMNRYKFAF